MAGVVPLFVGDLFGGAGRPSEDAVQQRLRDSGRCVVGQSESSVPPVDLLDCFGMVVTGNPRPASPNPVDLEFISDLVQRGCGVELSGTLSWLDRIGGRR
jgi:hypothetical protein